MMDRFRSRLLLVPLWALMGFSFLHCGSDPVSSREKRVLIMQMDSLKSDLTLDSLVGTLDPGGIPLRFEKSNHNGSLAFVYPDTLTLPDSGSLTFRIYTGDSVVASGISKWSHSDKTIEIGAPWDTVMIAKLIRQKEIERNPFGIRLAALASLNGESDLFLWTGDSIVQMGTAAQSVSYPVLTSGFLAWIGGSGTNAEVFVHTTVLKQITTNSTQETGLNGWGPKLVWSAAPATGQKAEIYLWNQSGMQRVTNNETTDGNPTLSGQWLGWEGQVQLSSTTFGSRPMGSDAAGANPKFLADSYGVESQAVDSGVFFAASNQICFWNGSKDTTLCVFHAGDTFRDLMGRGDLVTGVAEDVSNRKRIFIWNGRDDSVTIISGINGTPGEGYYPHTNGSSVVWISNNESSSNIYYWNGTGSRQFQPSSSNQESPKIFTDKGLDYIAWVENISGRPTPVLHNLELDTSLVIDLGNWSATSVYLPLE